MSARSAFQMAATFMLLLLIVLEMVVVRHFVHISVSHAGGCKGGAPDHGTNTGTEGAEENSPTSTTITTMGQFCYVTTVFNDYEHLRVPPTGLPTDWLTFYITDNPQTATDATTQFGWKSSIALDPNYYRSPNFRFRLTMIANARIWPERLLPDLHQCDHLAFGDGNVETVDQVYLNWVQACAKSGTALNLLNGWYPGHRDNALTGELQASVAQSRWAPDADAMRNRVAYYEAALMAKLNTTKESLPQIEVISAKYIVWNLKHPQRHVVAEWLAAEYSVHLQGNIILSVAAYLFPDLIWVSNYDRDFRFQPTLAKHARNA